jgi:hypothetical protein
MVNKTIEFSTGKLIINETNISFHQNRGNVNNVNTIGRENIGHMNKQSMRLLPHVDFVYIFRIAILGVALIILGFIIAMKSDMYFLVQIGCIFIIFAGFLMFSSLFIDGLLGLKVAESILLMLFGVDAYRIVVQNIFGGNNLIFLIRDDEISKIPKFEDYKLEKIHKVENTKSPETAANNIDDIEKLANLRDKGILSQEEFDLKKKQILGI